MWWGYSKMIGEILEGIYWFILAKWITDDDEWTNTNRERTDCKEIKA